MIRSLAFLLLLCSTATAAQASPFERVEPVRDPLTLKECGECHMAYPAGLLPAAAWRTIMGNLSHHYGDNATLSADKAAAILDYLQRHAGPETYGKHEKYNRHYPPQGVDDAVYITRTSWFRHKHRKISTAKWQDPTVKTPSNCAACHKFAEQGWFDDD